MGGEEKRGPGVKPLKNSKNHALLILGKRPLRYKEGTTKGYFYSFGEKGRGLDP